MVTRNYQAPAFGVRDQRQVTQRDVAQSDNRVQVPLTTGDDQWRDKLLVDLAGTGAQVLNKMADIEYSNLYLEGQAAAGQIESEEELQGNPLTRDWKVAGYRDTMGKLALADMEASLASDMVTLREKSPEAMSKYLAERRAKFLPGMNSMSREARATSAGQLLLQDRAAIKKHNSEHTKYIIEKKSQAIATQHRASISTLKSAQLATSTGDMEPAAFTEQIRSSAGQLVGSIWLDQSLPMDVKQQLTLEAIQGALAEDMVPLYDYLHANDMPDGRGGRSTLLSRLSLEDQTKVSNSYRDAMTRTADQRNLYRIGQIADIDAQITNDSYRGSYEDLDGHLSRMVLNKTIPGSKRESLLNKFLDKQYKRGNDTATATAFSRGDINALYAMGKTPTEGAQALSAMLARNKAGPDVRLNTFLQAGMNGMEPAFKMAGEQLGVSLRAMRQPDGTVLPQHLQVFQTINEAVKAAEANGHLNARVQLLSGLGEEDRMFADRIFRMRDEGSSYDEAARKAKDMETTEQAYTPSIRAAMAEEQGKAVRAAVNNIAPMGLLESFWEGAKGLVGMGDQTTNAMRPRTFMGSTGAFDAIDRNWDDSDRVVRFYNNTLQTELQKEASHVQLTHPGAGGDEVVRVAKTNLLSRTISTSNGPVFLPKGVNVEQQFGVPAAMQSKMGPAIDALLTPTKAGTRWEITATDGIMAATEYDKEGVRVSSRLLSNVAIRESVGKLIQQDVKKADERIGKGKTVEADGVKVNYNGRNSAGVEYDWMFDYRTNLVNHEGVRSTAYDDLSGNKDKSGKVIRTVGVGVSSHNPHFPKEVGPDGRVPDHAIQRSFLDASNDAAEAGARTAKEVGVYNKPGFMLMSELAYQSGTAFLSQQNNTGKRYQEFAQHLRGVDVNAAQEAFKKTAAWYYSRDPKKPDVVTRRQKAYLDMIEQSMKE